MTNSEKADAFAHAVQWTAGVARAIDKGNASAEEREAYGILKTQLLSRGDRMGEALAVLLDELDGSNAREVARLARLRGDAP